MLIGPHIGLLDILFLLLAGFGAGVVGSTAGLASLISYPVLLAIGLPPVTANVTNTVGLIGSSVGSVSGSRVELRGQGKDILRWLPVAAVGGPAGAALLLLGPAGAFEAVVPYLVAGASVLLLTSPKLRNLRARRALKADAEAGAKAEAPGDEPNTAGVAATPGRTGVAIGLFFTCVYGGYFGAAAGVMILALLLAMTHKSLPAANAAKNLLLGVANAVAAVGFIIFADVRWAAVIPLAIGCVAGGATGPAIVRRVPPGLMRTVIAIAGFGLAIKLWVS